MKKGLICLLVTSMLVSIPSIARADEEAVKQAQAKYNEYVTKIEELESVVMSLDTSIHECLDKIDSNNTEIVNLNTQIKESNENIKSLESDIVNRELMKDSRVRQMYMGGNVSVNYLSMLLSADNVIDFFKRLSALGVLIDLDNSIVETIESNKKEIQEELKTTENSKKKLVVLNKEIEQQKKDLDSKKVEQESIIASIEEEKNRFGVEVLEVAERELVQPHIKSIGESRMNLQSLQSIVSRLTALKNNQIQTEAVQAEIDSAIEEANGLISSLRIQNSGATISNPARGNVGVTGQDIVDYAYQFLGIPYVWGATGPSTFDCSGLTSYVYRHCANLEITRTTYTQINVGIPVAYNEMQPGDLVFMRNNEHVGIYIGNGQMIHAPRTGDVVKVSNVFSFYAARRIL